MSRGGIAAALVVAGCAGAPAPPPVIANRSVDGTATPPEPPPPASSRPRSLSRVRATRTVPSAPGVAELGGRVRDLATGEVMTGVTVVAIAAGGRVHESTITEDDGSYLFTGLPAEPWQLAFYFSSLEIEVPAQPVRPGWRREVDLDIDMTAATEEIILGLP